MHTNKRKCLEIGPIEFIYWIEENKVSYKLELEVDTYNETYDYLLSDCEISSIINFLKDYLKLKGCNNAK